MGNDTHFVSKFFESNAYSWELNIWRLTRIICKRLDRWDNLIRILFLDLDTTSHSSRKTETFMYSHWHMSIPPKCPALRLWCFWPGAIATYPWYHYIWCPDGVTDWFHIDYISPRTTTTIATMHTRNMTRRQQQDEEGEAALQRQTWQWRSAMCHKRFTPESRFSLIVHLLKPLRKKRLTTE